VYGESESGHVETIVIEEMRYGYDAAPEIDGRATSESHRKATEGGGNSRGQTELPAWPPRRNGKGAAVPTSDAAATGSLSVRPARRCHRNVAVREARTK